MSQTPRANSATRPSHEQVVRHLRRANEVGAQAAREGRHPFGAILVAPDHETVLMEQGNIDTVNHAESTLARRAAAAYDAAYLWGCTLYTSVEPCCMCAGTAYWAHIGRVVYGMTEQALLAETGSHEQNPTLSVSSHYVFEHGQKPVDLIGPVAEIEPEVVALQRAFWSAMRR
ncbi:MAG: nucleoside deaminase [Burkholderiales bacterium]|nr:nucleoside deaminase [Burkholderiales bacterium]